MKPLSISSLLQPKPLWCWSLLRPGLPLLFAWAVLSALAAFARPFEIGQMMGGWQTLFYWPIVIAFRGVVELLVRHDLRSRMVVPAWLSVVVDPVCVAMLSAPILALFDSLLMHMSNHEVLQALFRVYLTSLFVSACELVLVAHRRQQEQAALAKALQDHTVQPSLPVTASGARLDPAPNLQTAMSMAQEPKPNPLNDIYFPLSPASPRNASVDAALSDPEVGNVSWRWSMQTENLCR